MQPEIHSIHSGRSGSEEPSGSMRPSARNCQNCKQDFIIESDDFSFYEKVKVPAPTWCPDCRFQRRMSWRNFWHLFKKTDAHTGEKIFSLFPEESPVKIYEKEYWNSDAWDPFEYGIDCDFSKPFFKQFNELMYSVPFPAHSILNLVNCRYCTNAGGLKNCYLVRAATDTEDSAYLIWDHASKRCMDSFVTDHCELGYGNVNTQRSFKTLFSVDCKDCNDVILSKDCTGCNHCFGCVGLRNKSYYFFNQQLTKEEYKKRLEEENIGSAKSLQVLSKKAHDFWLTFPQKYIHGRQNVDVSGDYIYESKNAKISFIVRESENIKFCQNFTNGPVKDCYDFSNWGENVELLYECLICGNGNSKLRFCMQSYPNNRNLEYCVFCQRSSDLFGCVGLKDKQYCIFNKQYSKEEYETLVSKMKKHMNDMPYVDKKGRVYKYGEFFPPEFSTFPYHITEAQDIFPLTEAQAVEQGFLWYPIKSDEYTHTISQSQIPDHINDVQDAILNEVLACEHHGNCAQECTKAFKIVKEEIEFCRHLNIPIPRLCPNCRHYERLAWRNSSRLYKRKCTCSGKKSENGVYQNTIEHFHKSDHCPNEFETSYAPDRPEIVYCEQCYQAEVA